MTVFCAKIFAGNARLPRAARGIILRAVMLLAGCGGGAEQPTAPAPAPAPPYPAGLSEAALLTGAVTRSYRVHVPPKLDGAPKAIVLALHGGGGEGLDSAELGRHALSVFRTVADREGFVVVYPGGLPALDGNAAWSDCRSDNTLASNADDVGFLAALIERVRSQYGLPNARVFMAGGSNGGLMTLSFAAERPAALAAVATSSANLPLNPRPGACSTGPTQPVPALLTHGTADPQMPYLGGCVANLGGACNRGRVIAAEQTRDRWLQLNGVAASTPSQTAVEIDPNDGGPANRFDYGGPAPVQWWRLDGAGHAMASRSVLTAPNAASGSQNRDIEFAEVAWAFFAARLP